MPSVADILIPLALDNAYSYAVPAGLVLSPGDVVQVPLGPRETVGVVWQVAESPGGSNLRQVTGRVEAPPLSDPLRELVDWLARYTLAPKGSALAMALRLPDEAARGETSRIGVRASGKTPARPTPARMKVLAVTADGTMRGKSALAKEAGVSLSVVDGLIDDGALEAVALAPEPVALPPDPDHERVPLSEAQDQAARKLIGLAFPASEDAKAPTILLEGVTGSGKTEVYFEAVAEAVRHGHQALILMPEIALTAQFLDRFAERFGVRPATWHSGIGSKRRERLRAGVAAGEVAVVVGARSALFLPFSDLGLVVVDEEHEAAYKQEDGVHYHARDMAVVRGRLENCPVVLASATPSIETKVNAEKGRYAHIVLPERFGGRRLPDIHAIDMRLDKPEKGRFLAPPLVNAVRATIEAGDQALLFLNRRGYAPLTLCRACGHRYQCRNCSTWLVEHRFRRALVCHQCGYAERRPDACTECGTFDNLTPCGPGVERIAEEVAELFPDKRVIVLSSDFPGGAERLRAELQSVADGECDIVIGTQLVAKGHNFPHLTLVGVLDADIGLTSGDPRAAERTFQLLQQVTGRAGRGDKPGRALVQTYQPDHPVIAALLSGDATRFYEEEIASREAAGLPPFGRLAALIVSANEREVAEAHGQALARAAEPPEGIMVLGPAEAPLALIRGRYRFRLLVKTERAVDLQAYLRDWLGRGPKVRGNVKVAIDVDPQSFL
ncbi:MULTISPECIES: primosomal protein N' [Methylobacterium]|uniref:Replication restart protein PriA n=1 Tax=Methylobacterium bullatum TaxID=570505 RepID=A0A679JA54_9HYPH|nr:MULTISPECIES: primosomal protein N' [Methylobacterium]MBD8903434.1 primosomal protein N' [Methylobacterium bullatum]TXN32927.1 primosomal protein N' [Methylobacterium sp. WL19]GJD40574.1 Primosomal protein N' [Methylobacterium bullatum]CAA2136361.1 Primosomal protein N' [Methylobacterium bullatum]